MQVYEGIRILDFTLQEQGPVGVQVLASYGADVIKIERPDGGDGMRGRKKEGSLNGIEGYGFGFIACNTNKRGMAINLKTEEGKEIVKKLVETADVVVSNFRPGVMERLGLGYDDLSEINPRIICAYASGYGQTGPYREKMGQDLAAQAMAGLICHTGGYNGERPYPAGYNLCDFVGGMFLAQGIMLALAAREKTGKGQVVDTSLLNAGLVLDILGATGFLNNGKYRPLNGEGTPNPIYSIYKTKDESWVAVINAFRDEPLRRLCEAFDIPSSVAEDPRFQDMHQMSQAEYDELRGIFEDVISKMTRDEVIQRVEQQNMLAAPVYEYPEVFEDPQVIHNGMIQEVTHPVAGHMKVMGLPVKLSDTPGEFRMPAPLLGEHNENILKDELGYSEEEIAEFYSSNILNKHEILKKEKTE